MCFLMYVLLFCLFFPELRTEPRALCLLGKYSTNELIPQMPPPINHVRLDIIAHVQSQIDYREME